MRQLVNYFTSRIRFKVILPYAVLTLVVAVIGVYLSTQLVSDSLEERFTRQLVEASSVAAAGLAQQEENQLEDLRFITFMEGLDQAVVEDNDSELQNILWPIVGNRGIDRVDILDAKGEYIFGLQRPFGATSVDDYQVTRNGDALNWTRWPTVQNVINGKVDEWGDKFVGLETINEDMLFFTVGPLKQGDEIVGVVMVSSYLRDILRSLAQATFADVSLHNLEGEVIATTLSTDDRGLTALALGEQAQLIRAIDGESSFKKSVGLGNLEYDVFYSVFRARGETLGFYSVALQTTFMVSYRNTARNQMVFIFAATLLLVFLIGYFTANAITRPVQHLMENALAVASGDFSRRTDISSRDEIGSLARSLDHMTDNLANYTNKLQSRIDELMLLYESSTAVTVKSGLNLDYILDAIVDNVRGVIPGTDQVVVYLLSNDKKVLEPIVAKPRGPVNLAGIPYGQHGTLWSILSAGKPKIIDTSMLVTGIQNGKADPEEDRAQALVVPLLSGQDTVGMIALLPNSTNAENRLTLDEDNERLLMTLANPAAIAIKNAQLFEATQKAYEELRQLDDLKTEFINIAAHELRTPLGAMIGYASYIEKRVPPKLHKSTRFLIASSLRLRTMVDAMLAIQRLDAGTAFLRLTQVNVRDIVKKAVMDFQPMAELEGHVIEVNVPEKLPPVQADAEKVGLVLSNLISNAIKFTPEGGRIEISARDYLKGVLISVKDNGVGISPKDQAQIFERFYQARPEHIAGHGGMGIGLTIVKHLVELHDGQVWVESEENKGSTFSFTLPHKEPNEVTITSIAGRETHQLEALTPQAIKSNQPEGQLNPA